MMELLFSVLFIAIFGKMILLAGKMAWGILKVILYLIFLPVILVWSVFEGLVKIALPVLLIVGIISLFERDNTVA